MTGSRRQPPRRLNSFTLIELLVVLAIMAILASLSIPAFLSVVRSSSLTAGGTRLVDQFNLARQTAIAKNCEVEFRLYELPDPSAPSSSSPTVYRAFQSFSLDHDGSQTNAITKVITLPANIAAVNNSTVSSLLPASPSNPPYSVSGSVAGTPLGAYPPNSYRYMDFHFKPDGSTDLNLGSTWFISLANPSDPIQGTTGLPNNFVTVQVDAQSGHVRSFRPN